MNELDPTSVTFLLGSGVSIPSSYPSTAEITSDLLKKNWLGTRDTARYPESPHWMSTSDYSVRIAGVWGLIRLLRSHIEQHLALQAKGEANYEDIYYLGRQLLDSFRGEYDNPGLLPFLFDLRAKVEQMLGQLNANYEPNYMLGKRVNVGLNDLLAGTLEFIEEAVAEKLALRQPIRGLDLLDECRKIGPLHIVTLNHDTLLETHFSAEPIRDGFSSISENAAEFEPKTFDATDEYGVMLLKLHGSINWYRYKTKAERDLVVRVQGDPNRVNRRGEDLFAPVGRMLLAGTTNKELAYGSGVFLELMYQFHRRLKETRLLIVSGYGFADKGINSRIWAWVDSHPENRLCVLHSKFDELRASAKSSFSINLERLQKEKRLVLINRWMCDCTLADITSKIETAC